MPLFLSRGSGPLRQRRAAKEVAETTAEWRDTFGIRDDGKVRCVSDHRFMEPFANLTRIQVASSDATNIRTAIRQEGDEIVINGHKWFVCSFAMYQLVDMPRALQVH